MGEPCKVSLHSNNPFMRHYLFPLLLAAWCSIPVQAQKSSVQNIVIITLDGMRWQEVFGGADSILLRDPLQTYDTAAFGKKFWTDEPSGRREKLFPFLWGTVATKGMLLGNRNYDNKVNNANPYWFSYPGYNELFTGYPDTAVDSNDKNPNKNISVLEYINNQKAYAGKVAVFSTWDVFPYIFNTSRSKLYVNSDVDTLRFKSSSFDLINDIQFLTTRPIGVRPDVLTYIAGREYLKTFHPRVLYIAFDETDDFAHGGRYDQYLNSAHAEDAMIGDLWNTLQSIPQYKNTTALIITCDHGRGDKVKQQWKDHGSRVEGSSQIWIAAMGPGIQVLGESRKPVQLYQGQMATTIARLLGLTFQAEHTPLPPISEIIEPSSR
jgi:hypothetical protein